MKFLVFTDLHGNLPFVNELNRIISEKNVDFALCLGDVTDMGTGEEAASTLSKIACTVYAMPGNCDARDFPVEVSNVCHDIHGKRVMIDDVPFIGLGGSNITIFDTPFELREEEITEMLEPISVKGMVLATHAPGYDILDHIPNGMAVGSPAIRSIIEKYEPILALSGHIHEDIGIKEFGNTICCNPGPGKEGYCAVVTIDNNMPSIEMLGPWRS